MTEAEWLTASEPTLMLEFLEGNASERKLRLFAVLCYREYLRFRPDLIAGISLRWADVTEKFADRTVTLEEWEGVRSCVHGAFHAADPNKQALSGVDTALACCPHEPSELQLLARFLREIFGSPFRPVAFSPSWRTDTAVTLARQMYDARDFGAMPILADALQDAGCDSDDILSHSRNPGEHVRGCWVVDLVLGKE